MLLELYIKNLALIDEARVQFGRGLNILTGETGAGKTVVVSAVNLLLGSRADVSLVRRDSDRAEVQGIFLIPPGLREKDERISDLVEDSDQLIIHRIISTDGKNKCYVNDRMVTVGMLSEIGKHLIDLHGQHEHQTLFKTSSHIDYLDKYGGRDLLILREKFQEKSKMLRQLKDELEKLRNSERELLSKKDLLSFQVNEIDRANLALGEDAELMQERDILRNAEKIYSAVSQAIDLLSGDSNAVPATELIARAVSGLKSIFGIDSSLDELTERLNGFLIEIEDCVSSLHKYGSRLDFPPDRLQEVEDRLALIALLKKKYGSTIEDILAYRNTAFSELQMCDISGEKAVELERMIISCEEELAALAQELSRKRKEVGRQFEKEVIKELYDLNMPNAEFKVLFTRELDNEGLLINGERLKVFPYGIDKVEFLISANKGEPVAPLAKIASGGEISRVMLALKIVLADADEVPTLIFDEVDAGIGGKTATAVGKKMSILSRKHQVLSVTHLPQIASFADKHFSVSKREVENRTITEVEELLYRDQVNEIARLLSGDESLNVSLLHAEELILEAKRNKGELVSERAN